MKLLVTGATGLIGNEIVNLCRGQNIAINYLTRSKNSIISKDKYQGFYWNPSTSEIDLDCFNGVSAIINLAGASISKRWTHSYKHEILGSRLNALRTLNHALEKVDKGTIRSFVSASAVGIYPHSFRSFYTEEEKSVDDSFLGEVVETWEKEVDTLQRYNFNISKIRIGLVMSPIGGALPEMERPIKYGVGAPFGNGQQWQSWIHVNDLARIFLFAVENGLQGIYNGVGPNPVTNKKLVREIAKVLGKPLILPNIPRFAMKILLGEMSYILFASQRVSSKKIEEEGFIFKYQNICRALEGIYEQNAQEELQDTVYTKKYLT